MTRMSFPMILVAFALMSSVAKTADAAEISQKPAVAEPNHRLPQNVAAPPLRQLKSTGRRVLRPCESAVASPELDSLILLRGDALYRQSLVEPFGEEFLGRDDSLADRLLAGAIPIGKRLYVLLNDLPLPRSEGRPPILFDCARGQVVPLLPKDITLQAGESRLHAAILGIAPQRGGAAVALGGEGLSAEDQHPGNRPFYCWINLQEASVEFLSEKYWSPLYSDATGGILVFQERYTGHFQRPPRHALDLQTGRPAERLPKIEEEPCVPSTWVAYEGSVKPLVQSPRRGQSGDVVGVSIDRRPVLLPFPDGLYYSDMAGASRDLAGVHASNFRSSRDEGWLWVAPRDGRSPARPVCRWLLPTFAAPKSFAIINCGRCVFAADWPLNVSRPLDVRVYEYSEHQSWSLFDNADALLQMTSQESKAYYETLKYQITPTMGAPGDHQWVLVQLRHVRYDARAFVPTELNPLAPGTPPRPRRLPPQKWHKSMLVSCAGQRYEVDLGEERIVEALLHKTGTVVLKKPRENEADRPRQRFDLVLLTFDLPDLPH